MFSLRGDGALLHSGEARILGKGRRGKEGKREEGRDDKRGGGKEGGGISSSCIFSSMPLRFSLLLRLYSYFSFSNSLFSIFNFEFKLSGHVDIGTKSLNALSHKDENVNVRKLSSFLT